MKKTPEKPQTPERFLTSSNHSFYVGKFIPRTFREKLGAYLAGQEKSRIYSEEFYLMLLKEAFSRTKEGGRPRIILAPQLSEIFNGESDVKRALDAEEQEQLLRKLAKRHFGRDDVEIESVEDQPRHQPLFQALRGAVDPETGQLDLEKALEDPKDVDFSEKPDSLEIARHLYAATKSSDTLKMVFKHAAPKRFMEAIEENEDSPKGYYAMAELAIRLADVLAGVEIHGGAERQAKYDEPLAKIIKGKKGGYRTIPQLQKLFTLMEGQRFNTIHLKTKENPYAESRRKSIQNTRRTVGVLLGITVLGIAFEQGIKHEQREREKIEEAMRDSMNERLKDKIYYLDGHRWPVPREHTVAHFEGIVDRCQDDLKDRYKIPKSLIAEMRALLIQYLLEHEKETSMDRRDYPQNRFSAVDRFVQRHRIFLQSKGIEVGQPYAELMPYLPYFEAAAMGREDSFEFSFKSEKRRGINRQWQLPEGQEESLPTVLKRVGDFNAGQPTSDSFAFYLYESPEGTRLLAEDSWKGQKTGERIFTAERGREGALQFIYMTRVYAGLELKEKRDERFQTRSWREDKTRNPQFISPCVEESREDGNRNYMPEVGRYEDPLGCFGYEFMVISGYDNEKGTFFPCLLAKELGESHFTYERGEEMEALFNDVHYDRRYDYYRGKYYEPMIPLDLPVILKEVDEAAQRAAEIEQLLAGRELDKDTASKLNDLINYYPDKLREDAAKYDGSYKATKETVERLEKVRDGLKSVRFRIRITYPELLPAE